MKGYKAISFVLGAIILITATATASVYFSGPPARTERVVVTQNAKPKCDDGNISGKVVGGVGGGVLGSLAGKGSGKTATTIGGTLAGAYVGGKTIPLQNVTCK